MAVVSFLIFASAFAVSIAVLWASLAPAMPRIVSILRNGEDVVGLGNRVAIEGDFRVRSRVWAPTPPVRSHWRAAA